MKILIVSNFFPPEVYGGYEIGCSRVAEALRERGHGVRVLTSMCEMEDQREWVSRKLISSFKMDVSAMPRLKRLRTVFRHESENRAAFSEELRSCEPDLVYFWNLGHVSRSLLNSKISMPSAIYLFDHGMRDASSDLWLQHTEQGESVGLVKRITRAVMKAVMKSSSKVEMAPESTLNQVHFPTDYLQRYYPSEEAGHAKWVKMPWGVDTKRYAPLAECPARAGLKLLYAGQISKHKGVHVLLHALGQLVERCPGVALTLAGRCLSPDYEKQLREIIAEHDLESCTEWRGFVAEEDLPSLYREHDALVFPSLWEEPMGITILEAMASGLLVVSSGTGGSGELFEDGVHGFTYDKDSATELADKLAQFVEHPDVLKQMGEAARRHTVECHDFNALIDQIEDSLNALIQ